MPTNQNQEPLFPARPPAPFTENDLLDGRVSAALADPLLDERDRYLLRTLSCHRGAERAIAADALLRLLHAPDSTQARRWLKATIEDFVVRLRVPIGGSRQKPYGYFLIARSADLDVAIHPLWSECYSLMRRLRALTSTEDVARLFGQELLKLEEGEKRP